jgi:gluconate 2-dehydrogenase gamma chain
MELNDAFEMDRRSILARIALLVGASAVPAEAIAAVAKTKAKRFLAPAQYAVLSAVADTIVPATDTPGALAVGVPAKFDQLLAKWASAKRKVELTGALTEIDTLAMTSDKKGFAALTPARRKALLLAHDKAAVKPGAPPKEKLTGLAAMVGGTPVANPGYVKVKDLIIALYYNSEIAMTKELVYEHVPGKFVPSFNVTPQTRPFAGVGGPF